MTDIKISPALLKGSVRVPASKSAAHRMILAAALARGVSRVYPICHSADIDATIDCVKALGATVTEKDNSFIITGINRNEIIGKEVTLNCRESGSTLRFLIPIAAALGVGATFLGEGRLPKRPIDEICGILRDNGLICSGNSLPLTIKGKLTPGKYFISGNVSSQFLTGLLLAMPILKGEASVTLTTELQSKAYVDMTVETMKHFGIETRFSNGSYETAGDYVSTEAEIEGDWSQACFYMSAALSGGEISLRGLNPHSLQGDKAAIELFTAFGAEIYFENNLLQVKSNKKTGCKIDCSQIPDMVPSLAVAAALTGQPTTLFGAGRLRFKESDRIKTTVNGLKAMGIEATELRDGIEISGGTPTGGVVDGAGDHRIVMAFSILASFAKGDTVIKGYEAIDKSYPNFFEDFKAIGGIANVITDR